MCTEAVLGNAIAPVSSAFVPSAVLMLPMVRTMILPRVVVCSVLFVYFARACLPVVRLPMCPLPIPGLMFPPLVVPAIRVVHSRARVLLVLVALFSVFLLGTTLFALVSVLCRDKSGASKSKS
jgi:hypothetical protein